MNLRSPATRFGVSLAAAVIMTAVTWRSLARARGEGAAGPTAQVLIARKMVAPGRAVDAADVESRVIPLAFAEPGAFRDIKDVRGSRARIALAKGEQITRSKIESESSRLGLSWTLQPGSVAMSLRLPSESAVGGHALPGDWVDVFAAGPRPSASAPIVRRARVVAVQDRVWDPAGAPASPFSGVGSNDSLLVTLMLTSEQVSRVATAVDRGHLTLALRSPLEER